ncbi:MAG TPA: TlyA family rRNA (cytidine-2'-O)-methyltransferase [Anaerolineaceae bacterium]|nr:TlyA family rRNA (cytidine-2'-O)-methyltransferase [Anaerolineaceae bacterium]
MKKKRLDVLMVEKNLAESRSLAQRLIIAGEVWGNGSIAIKPSETYVDEIEISLKQTPPFVSRGGEKLEAALQAFKLIELEEKICVDVGASTGGFTDCLLQHGAAKVYALDVGYGQLHWKLRNDARVVVMEKTNIRDVESLPEKADVVVVDVSFISLKMIFPILKRLVKDESSDLVTLIKPQFEAGREEAARGKGVIRDTKVHKKVVASVLEAAQQVGLYTHGLILSPIKGPKGNIEFLAHLRCQPVEVLPGVFVEKLFNTILMDE